MTNISEISVDISSPYPSSQEVTTHELNKGLTRFIDVSFYDNSQELDFTGVTVTATIVCNGYLIVEDKAPTSVIDNVVRLNISSTTEYTILPGLMYIEFKFTQNATELYPPTPVVVNVNPSIVDDAQVTPESYGTVSEILQEVAEARGSYNSLDDRLDAIESDIGDVENHFPIKSYDIDSGAVIQGKLGVGAVDTANIDGGAVTLDKLDSNTVYESTPTSGSSKLLTSGGAYTALAGISVDENQIDDGAVTYNKFAPDALNYINGKLPYSSIVKNVGGVPAGVDITYINSLTFDKKTFYYVWFAVDALFSGSPREWCVFLELESDYQIAIRPNGDIYYRQYSNAQWSDFVNKFETSLVDVILADYSLGFDVDGTVKSRANVTGLTTLLSGCKSVYTAPKCTTLTSQFKSVNPNLTDIYVDNYSEDMTIDSSITSDSSITIHYKGTFKLIDLLTASQKELNDRLTTLETTIGILNSNINSQLNLNEGA